MCDSFGIKPLYYYLFSELLILLEHPFGIGDWIRVGEVEGIVEDPTFCSTAVRAG